MKYFKQIFIVLLISIYGISLAQDNPAMKTRKVKHLLSLGPVISFFKNGKFDNTTDVKSKAGFNAAYRMDILIKKRMSFVLGAEFFTQGIAFRGYYKVVGQTTKFDDTFPYTHEIRFSEALLPLGMKFNFNREKDKNYTPYIIAGIDFRYIYKSYYVIIDDKTGITPYDGKGALGFQHYLFLKNLNNNFKLTFAIQRNYRKTGKAAFVEFTYRMGVSRLLYEGVNYSNFVRISNSSLAVTLGLRL